MGQVKKSLQLTQHELWMLKHAISLLGEKKKSLGTKSFKLYLKITSMVDPDYAPKRGWYETK